MGKLSRDKGAKYERLITNLLRHIFGDSIRRGIGQERSGGEIADVDGLPRFWVQTKHGSPLNISIRTAVAQAEAEIQIAKTKHELGKAIGRTDRGEWEEKWPLVVVRYNGERDLATMRLEHFAQLVAEWHYMRQALCLDGVERWTLDDGPGAPPSSVAEAKQKVLSRLEQFSKGDSNNAED